MPEFDGRAFRLHYEECGDGEPVLLLPGYLMDHHLFDAPGRSTVQPLPLHLSRPPRPRPERLSTRAMVDGGPLEDVVALIEVLGVHPSHLVGMSIGGAEATRTTTSVASRLQV